MKDTEVLQELQLLGSFQEIWQPDLSENLATDHSNQPNEEQALTSYANILPIILFYYAHDSAYYSSIPAYYSNLISCYAHKESTIKAIMNIFNRTEP